jgi:hypothetical protein
MKTLLTACTLAIASLGTAAAALAADPVQEARVATGFSKIAVAGHAEVLLRQGTSEGVTIEALPQVLRQIETEVDGSTLNITASSQRRWWDGILGGGAARPPRITIHFINLQRIEAGGAINLKAGTLKAKDLRLDLSGASTLRIDDLQASRLRLDGSGAIKVELAGNVPAQFIDLSGAGAYQAADLASETAVLQVSGAGKALVNASKKLKAEISGAGLVEYLGHPSVEQETSGAGRVRRRDGS